MDAIAKTLRGFKSTKVRLPSISPGPRGELLAFVNQPKTPSDRQAETGWKSIAPTRSRLGGRRRLPRPRADEVVGTGLESAIRRIQAPSLSFSTEPVPLPFQNVLPKRQWLRGAGTCRFSPLSVVQETFVRSREDSDHHRLDVVVATRPGC